MIGSIGGIEVVNPIAFDDQYLKPDGFPKGRIHLGSYDAMVFARIRKNLIGGDFDRSANQQRVLRGIQGKVRAKAHVPGFIERGVLSVMQHLHTDLPPAELFRLAQAMAHVEPSKITNCVIQGGIGNIGGASVVIPNVTRRAASATRPARTPRSSTAELGGRSPSKPNGRPRQDSNLRLLVPETSALSPELRRQCCPRRGAATDCATDPTVRLGRRRISPGCPRQPISVQPTSRVADTLGR